MKFLVIIFLLLSCASKNIILNESSLLPYQNMSQVTKVNMISQSFALKGINDNRTEKTYGFGYTGVQYDKTPIKMGKNFVPFFEDYITDAFASRNLVISSEGTLSLEVDVREMKVEEIIEKFQPERAKCKANLTFHVQTVNKKWSGNFWTEYLSSGDLSDGSERLAPTLASCMNEIIEKLVNNKEFLEIIK